MTHTSEFLSLMADRDHDERVSLMERHIQQHGDAAMTESLRQLLEHTGYLITDPSSEVWEGLPDGIIEAFTDGNAAHSELVVDVWNTWVDVVAAVQTADAVPAPSVPAPVGTSAGRPSDVPAASHASTASSSSRCPSCGVPSVGLCNRCENQEILDDHIEYDRRLYEVDRDRIEHDRLRDDRTYYDTSPSYDTSYDSGYDSSHDDY